MNRFVSYLKFRLGPKKIKKIAPSQFKEAQRQELEWHVRNMDKDKLSRELSVLDERKRKADRGEDLLGYFGKKWWRLDKRDLLGKKILDVGCGPISVLDDVFYPALRVGVDPLAHSYKDIVFSSYFAQRVAGAGELLPFKRAVFDIITMRNVLKHVMDPEAILDQVYGTLKPCSLLCLMEPLTFSLASFSVDAKHPHNFTRHFLSHLLKRHGFKIIKWSIEKWSIEKKSPETRRMWIVAEKK